MIDLADKILKDIKPSKEEIISFTGYWIPLQWLYVEMRKQKAIPGIREYSEEEQQYYWKKTDKEKHKAIRIMQWQAIYVYDQITTD